MDCAFSASFLAFSLAAKGGHSHKSTVNAGTLRMNKDAQKLVQQFSDAKKPIATICHGPWLLINANRIQNKHLTSYPSIQLDWKMQAGNGSMQMYIAVIQADGCSLQHAVLKIFLYLTA